MTGAARITLPRRPRAARTVLALVDGAIAVEALRELHRVCLAMDSEQPECGGATEDEYDAAMRTAAEALRAYPPGQRVPLWGHGR